MSREEAYAVVSMVGDGRVTERSSYSAVLLAAL
jgi:hypothetical protein